MRDKLLRWRFPDRRQATLARRVLQRLTELRPLVNPRVSAAVLSTLWNRWATDRRYQRREAGRCVLRCSDTAEDSIEHYACCPVVRRTATRHLRMDLRPWPYALMDFMLATGPPSAPHPSQHDLVRMSLLLYATYNVTNAARRDLPQHAEEAAAMMQQSLWEGARGHPGSQRILQETWLP
jgi:hypothetical protein